MSTVSTLIIYLAVGALISLPLYVAMKKIYLERKEKLSGLICLPGNEHAKDITCQVMSMLNMLPAR